MRSYQTSRQSLSAIAGEILPALAERLEEKETQVKEIIAEVRRRGDAAVCEYVRRFDGAQITPAKLKVSKAEFAAARRQASPAFLQALEQAAGNIRAFHSKQLPKDWFNLEEGQVVGEKFTSLDKVGIHVPGATATYPSSLLMTVIPAQIAGVKEIHIATPPARNGKINPATLAAADFLGVDSVFKMAGAQAVAAFAYGTQTVPKVAKIFGPGNVYTMLAKRQVFGIVGIDGLYGPSEVVIIADPDASPVWAAADLLAQAEHGPDSLAVLISPSESLLAKVKKEVAAQVKRLPREKIAWQAWQEKGALVKTKDLPEAFALANLLAPEHLEVQVENAFAYLGMIKNAGCILLGNYTPVAASDYVAGPSHSLPTGGSAKFSSGLGVMDFVKRSDVVALTAVGLENFAPAIREFTKLEGLEGHNQAAVLRRPAPPRRPTKGSRS
jgi:histidinol dehydrogenase